MLHRSLELQQTKPVALCLRSSILAAPPDEMTACACHCPQLAGSWQHWTPDVEGAAATAGLQKAALRKPLHRRIDDNELEKWRRRCSIGICRRSVYRALLTQSMLLITAANCRAPCFRGSCRPEVKCLCLLPFAAACCRLLRLAAAYCLLLLLLLPLRLLFVVAVAVAGLFVLRLLLPLPLLLLLLVVVLLLLVVSGGVFFVRFVHAAALRFHTR